MRTSNLLIAALSFAILFFGCDKNVIPFAIDDDEVKIYNHMKETVYFTAFDRNILPVIDWAPSTDPEGENQIEAKRFRIIELEDIWSYEAGHDIGVYWWLLKKKTDNNGYQVFGFSHQVVSATRIQMQNTTVHINSITR